MTDAVYSISHTLNSANTLFEVFGNVDAPTTSESLAKLKLSYKRLASMTHPDKVPEPYKVLAGETFAKLTECWAAAQKALHDGTYDAPMYRLTIESPSDIYQLSDTAHFQGSFSSIYRGSNGKQQVLLKIASDPTCNPWLENEARALGKIDNRFVPKLLDSFLMHDDDRRAFRINVFPYATGYYSVEAIIEHFRSGLDPKDGAWIARRIMAQTLVAAEAGLVHGGITPDHILVHPLTHEPLHIGLSQSVKAGSRMTHIDDKWRDYYPPEVFDKHPVTHMTDVYMASKTIIRLLGGDTTSNRIDDVPKRLADVVLSGITQRRYNGSETLDRLTKAVRDLWGREYRPLYITQ